MGVGMMGAGTVTTVPPPAGVTRFRSGSWIERPLPSNAPIHPRNVDYLLELNGQYNGVETDGTFATDGPLNTLNQHYLKLLGGADGATTTSFDTPIYEVTGSDTSYTLTALSGSFFVPNRFKSVGDGGTGEGLRIPEIAKTHFLLGGPQSSDAPMCIYDVGRGYYANLAATAWNAALSRWEVQSTGAGSIYFTSSYGLDSNNTNDATTTNPAEWPSSLYFYQDNHENHGYRGNNPMCRVIDYDRMVAEDKVAYVTEMFAVRTGEANVFPMIGFESGKGGLIPEGTRLRIKTTIDVRQRLISFGLSGTRLDQATLIAKGLQDYGIYLGDNSGSGCRLKLQAFQRENRTNLWQVQEADIQTFGFGTSGDWEFIAAAYDPP